MKITFPDRKIMYDAMLRNDTRFEGIFFMGVKTTGIFCRPGCPAKKPREKNVDFFGSAADAISKGYRPCRICQPLGFSGKIPNWIQTFLDEVIAHPDAPLKDRDIKVMGMEPSRIRRWFKTNLDMTFQAYLRSLRTGLAYERIRSGEKVVNVAFDSGYNSLSGFSDSFQKITGFSPVESQAAKIITISRILTPLGPMIAGSTDQGLCLLEFVKTNSVDDQMARFRKALKSELVHGNNSTLRSLNEQINEYFGGKRKKFDLPLVLIGTHFQKNVWKILLSIPYGSFVSYKKEAELTGNPKAFRAVARANGENRISIVIPCHRVIGNDGSLIGYGGGLWRKKFLLNLESSNR